MEFLWSGIKMWVPDKPGLGYIVEGQLVSKGPRRDHWFGFSDSEDSLVLDFRMYRADSVEAVLPLWRRRPKGSCILY